MTYDKPRFPKADAPAPYTHWLASDVIATPFGTVEVCLTDAGHAHVSAGSNGENILTVRGKEYNADVHFYLIDGEWTQRSSTNASVNHRDWTNVNKREAAPTIRAKVIEACRLALLEYLATNVDAPTVAQRQSLTNRLGRAHTKLAEAEASYAEAQAKVRELRAELAALPAVDV